MKLLSSHILCALLALGLSSPAHAEDSYIKAMEEAAKLSRAGQHADAAAALVAVAGQYPQDFAMQLRLAWLHFQAKHYSRAEASYRVSLGLSPESWEARLGLGWSLFHQGKLGAARPHFAAVRKAVPDNPSARLGVEASKEGPAVTYAPWAAFTFSSYQDNPDLLWALSALVSLPLVIHQRYLLAGSYRLSRFTVPGPSVGGRGGNLAGFFQHEAFLAAGAAWSSVGIVAQYATLYDASREKDHAHVLGFSGRYSPWGDIGLAANISLYDDLQLVRIKSSYRLPLLAWLFVTPAFALQVAKGEGQANALLEKETEVLFSGELGLLLRGSAGSLWFGGKLGDELRPADLDALSVYNIDQRVSFSLHVGGRLFLDKHWALFASYQLDHLEPLDAPLDTNLHLFTLGLAWRPGEGKRR